MQIIMEIKPQHNGNYKANYITSYHNGNYIRL